MPQVGEKRNATRRRYYWKNADKLRAVSRKYLSSKYRTDAAFKARIDASGKTWRAANLEWDNFRRLLAIRGLTLDQYHARMESQDFWCAICGDTPAAVIDHNHATEQPRGILCYACNSGIGQLRESRELFALALTYLERWN